MIDTCRGMCIFYSELMSAIHNQGRGFGPANRLRRRQDPPTWADVVRLVFLLSVPVLLVRATCSAPAVNTFHEDLPAYSPTWGPPESRFGYHRVFWTDRGAWRPAHYFDLGCRAGQQTADVGFEQGVMATVFTSSVVAGPQVGISLARPSLALRVTWLPFGLAGHVNPDSISLHFDPAERWQVTVLGGTRYRPDGLGWGAGGRVSKQEFGPVLTGEFGSGVLSLRAELSAAFKAPWGDSTVRGQSITLGIGAAHHGRTPPEPR